MLVLIILEEYLGLVIVTKQAKGAVSFLEFELPASAIL
ncbi:MAG: hypothetical protein BMS9Abin15_0227 [Gammaproteobacteria bacterium]|nr:MAG: hypothetical protein BMS9Abin15_0227 [Gammaproteobacteria bacterium]